MPAGTDTPPSGLRISIIAGPITPISLLTETRTLASVELIRVVPSTVIAAERATAVTPSLKLSPTTFSTWCSAPSTSADGVTERTAGGRGSTWNTPTLELWPSRLVTTTVRGPGGALGSIVRTNWIWLGETTVTGPTPMPVAGVTLTAAPER